MNQRNAWLQDPPREVYVAAPDDCDLLVSISNEIAYAAYGEAFREVCDTGRLHALDLVKLQVPEPVPALRNGANKYFDVSSKPRKAHLEKFLRAGLVPTRHLIVAEVPNIARSAIDDTHAWQPGTAITSIRDGLARFDNFYFADRHSVPIAHQLRYFDSHPSVSFYWRHCLKIIENLGCSTSIPAMVCGFRRYKCDLGGRFRDLDVSALFVSNRFFSEERGSESQRGTHRVFFNEDAPNKEHLLLIGDSHSYSVMSHIFSHYFRNVTFFWANRINGYGSVARDIAKLANQCDLIIEESAERFFLANFTARSD